MCLLTDFLDNIRHLLTLKELCDLGLLEYLLDNRLPDILNRLVLCSLDRQYLVDLIHLENVSNLYKPGLTILEGSQHASAIL